PLYGPRPHRLPAIAGVPPLPAQRPAGCAFGPRCAYVHESCRLRPPPLVTVATGQDAACVLPAEGTPLPPRAMREP
ncbi:ABC transporter ATP-binding protein, partial [Komagataeibacter melaceti]